MPLTIDSIEMRNFMTHREENVEFPREGIVLLWGPSGAGKSSLLDAVGYSLFGLHGTRANNMSELHHELYPDEDMGVRVTFSLSPETQIQIFRGVEDGKSVVWMVGPDGELTESPKAVAQKVSELLGGMDAATFFSTYFSQQGELDALVRMAGGNRRKFIQRMLGISMLDKVTTRINQEVLKASGRLEQLDASIPEQSREELLEAHQAAREAHQQAARAIEDLQTESQALLSHGKSLSGQLKRIDAVADLYNRLTPSIQQIREVSLPALDAQITDLTSQLQEAEKASQRVAEQQQTMQELQQLRQEVQRLSAFESARSVLERLQEEEKQAREEHAQALAAVQKLASEGPQEPVAQLRKQLQGLSNRQEVLRSRIEHAEADLDRLRDDKTCFTCHREIDDPDTLLVGLEAALDELREQLTQATEQSEQARAQLQECERAEEQLRQANQQATQAEAHLKRVSAQLAEAQEQASGADAQRLQQARQRLDDSSQLLAQLESDRDKAQQLPGLRQRHQETQGKRAQLADQLREQQAQLADTTYDPEAHQQLRAETDQARDQFMTLRDRLSDAKEQHQLKAQEMTETQRLLDLYDKTLEDRKKAVEFKQKLLRLQSSMKDFRSHMINQIRPALEIKTSEHLKNLSSGKMPGVIISEDYDLDIKRPGGERRIGLCSGGEQARAAFSLRLALTQLVSQRTETPVGFCVYDEVFGSQDEHHRRAILESLRYSRAWYPQVFIISHEDTLRESELVDVVVNVPDSESVGRITVTAR